MEQQTNEKRHLQKNTDKNQRGKEEKKKQFARMQTEGGSKGSGVGDNEYLIEQLWIQGMWRRGKLGVSYGAIVDLRGVR